TWLLVKIKPSGVKTNPEPLPCTSGAWRGSELGIPPRLLCTSIFTTAGLTRSAALTTAWEYASSNCSAVGGEGAVRPVFGSSVSLRDTSRSMRCIGFTPFIISVLYNDIAICLNISHKALPASGERAYVKQEFVRPEKRLQERCGTLP